MTDMIELADFIESGAPSRWIAFLASAGSFVMITGLGSFLHANGFNERMEDIMRGLATAAFFLTWWEIRRPKEVAIAVRVASIRAASLRALAKAAPA